jgi:signal transduction histidine kinase
MDSYFFISGLLNFVVSVFFGIFIFSKGKLSRVNLTFSLFSFSVALWSFGYMFWPLSETDSSALFWFRFLHIGASFTSIAYLHFVVTWLEDSSKRNKVIIFSGYALAVFFVLQSFSPLFVTDVVPKFSMRYWGNPGILYHFYLIYFFGFFLYSSYLLMRSYPKTTGARHAQIRLILSGMILAFLGGSTNYLLWYDINFPPYGNILVGSYIVLTAYAIIRHRLMDIKLLARKSSVYFLSIVTTIIIAVGVKFLLNFLFPHWGLTADLASLILAVFIYNPTRNYYYRQANKYFFTSLYDAKEVIAKLSDSLHSTLSADKIYESIYEVLDGALHLERFGVVSFDEKNKRYVVEYNEGFPIGNRKVFRGNKILDNDFVFRGRIMIVEELREKYPSRDRRFREIFNLFDGLKVEILVPLKVKNKLSGILVLGSKEAGDIYNEEDLKVLGIVASQAALALENASLYEDTKDFNIKLKKEVNRATTELLLANEELKKLDAAKSEFLNIASHQLRTPVSVIRGVASMLVAGDMEKLPLEEKKKFYNSILAKSNKLEVIIHDILNATSLSAKKFSVMDKDAEMIDLAKLIKDVLRDFEMEIGERELEVTFEQGKKVPQISGQKEYLKEAFANLLTNAIKYTPTSKKTNDIRDTREGKGFLKIRIKSDPAEKNKVLVIFEDNGIGISQEDAPKLFKRFSRAQNAKNMYTDGTGIGLFVVKEIVEGHNGKVWFESELGKGTTFFVSLPIVSAKKINVKEHIIKKQQASLPA